MLARIPGAALAWVVSVAPLAAVNLIAYLGVFTLNEAALAGAVALVAGVALGALTAGLSGGRARDLAANAEAPVAPSGAWDADEARLGARGALVVGGIAATLYALTMGGLIALAGWLNVLPNIVAQHPLRITAAIICVAAIFLGLALLVGWLAARGSAPDADVAINTAATSSAAPAARRPVGAPTRPRPPADSVRGTSARATRPLAQSEYRGGPAYGDAFDDRGADGAGYAGGYGADARPSRAPSHPQPRPDPRYGAPSPARHARDPHDSRALRRRPADDDDNAAYREQRRSYDRYVDDDGYDAAGDDRRYTDQPAWQARQARRRRDD